MRQNRSRWCWLAGAAFGLAGMMTFAGCTRESSRAVVAAENTSPATPSQSSSANPVRVEVVAPTVGGIERNSVQPGSVYAFEAADLYAKVSGYLKSQQVDIGSRVKRGDVLAVIDAPELEKAVLQAQAAGDQAKAQVVQAEARITSAAADRDATVAHVKQTDAEVERAAAVRGFREKQYARIKSLYDLKSIDARLVDEKLDEMEAARAGEQAAKAGVVTAQAQVTAANAKVEQAKADLEDARANVEVAQAALDKAKVFVGYLSIVSPYEGVVTKRNFFRGDFIQSAEHGDRVPLLAVNRTDLMRVVVQVPDRDVPFVNPGDEAVVEIDALPKSRFAGKVARIADAEDSKTRTMRTEIDLPNPQNLLREGMYGRVTIHLAKSTAGLTIPSSALASDASTGSSTVFVVEKGVARLKKVRVGTDDGLRVEVSEGLDKNDQLIFRHRGALAEGAPVEVVR